MTGHSDATSQASVSVKSEPMQDEKEVEEQAGYLDDSTASGASASSSQTLGPQSLFALLAQRSAAQSQSQPSRSSHDMPKSQSEYDDLHSWTSSRPQHIRSQDSRKEYRNSTRPRHTASRHASSSSNSDSGRSDSDYSATDSDSDSALLQQEWEEQLDQIKLMFQIIVFPFFGKYLGRKYAYFLFDRYKSINGLFTRSFWGF